MTRKLDALVAEWKPDRINLIKIDVEGGEGKVLSGAMSVIDNFRPHFIIDLHNPTQDMLVAQLLASKDYRLSRLSGPPILRTDVGRPHKDGVWGTIMATPIV